jgi:alpha-tubulin suppressor-like RCC1 family protein
VYAPTPCAHLLGIPCRAAAAGSAHTAVVTRDGGGLYTFGSNQFGQLGCGGRGGDGGGGGGGMDVDGADADADDDGDDGAFCEVGGTSATPLLIDFNFDFDFDDDETREEIEEGRTAASSVLEVSCGSRHTAAVVIVGEKATTGLFAWGWNAHGQLGLGDRSDRPAPTRVRIPSDDAAAADPDAGNAPMTSTAAGATGVDRVSCGWWHTVVGVAR